VGSDEVATSRKVRERADELVVYLPDTRGVRLARWGRGNLKLGASVYTYSTLPGRPCDGGTCPGATSRCLDVCYAFRIRDPVRTVYQLNTALGAKLPELPTDARVVRWHVSGDFDSVEYIRAWTELAEQHPDVRFFGYTRSWRCWELAEMLNRLRDLPNVSLLASVDEDTELPPDDWRRAWLETDERYRADGERWSGVQERMVFSPATAKRPDFNTSRPTAIFCPEETGKSPNCLTCRYCVDKRRGDVVFKVHRPRQED
jgi:hypothetical protein